MCMIWYLILCHSVIIPLPLQCLLQHPSTNVPAMFIVCYFHRATYSDAMAHPNVNCMHSSNHFDIWSLKHFKRLSKAKAVSYFICRLHLWLMLTYIFYRHHEPWTRFLYILTYEYIIHPYITYNETCDHIESDYIYTSYTKQTKWSVKSMNHPMASSNKYLYIRVFKRSARDQMIC